MLDNNKYKLLNSLKSKHENDNFNCSYIFQRNDFRTGKKTGYGKSQKH